MELGRFDGARTDHSRRHGTVNPSNDPACLRRLAARRGQRCTPDSAS
jgi:hypothetical protein